MRKFNLFIAILFAIVLAGCDGSHDMKKNENGFLYSTNTVDPKNIENNYDVIEIDGCEYIVYSEEHGYGGYAFMAHKGNCKNPIHKH